MKKIDFFSLFTQRSKAPSTNDNDLLWRLFPSHFVFKFIIAINKVKTRLACRLDISSKGARAEISLSFICEEWMRRHTAAARWDGENWNFQIRQSENVNWINSEKNRAQIPMRSSYQSLSLLSRRHFNLSLSGAVNDFTLKIFLVIKNEIKLISATHFYRRFAADVTPRLYSSAKTVIERVLIS